MPRLMPRLRPVAKFAHPDGRHGMQQPGIHIEALANEKSHIYVKSEDLDGFVLTATAFNQCSSLFPSF
ncbi:hypothetical protein CKAH01_14054 [Colletotrichum kahawae]|uniref:Uncharacterized protein n=1 Tax=Colletotrichum kahawae TaxID=34407 RepID=A0AAE0DAN3_COLKA|nr:hypothetical protein CKAH01_14054 [Colletotrichum kahawae]